MGFYFLNLNLNLNFKKEKKIYSLLELVYLATNQLFSFFVAIILVKEERKDFLGEKTSPK
jgi:hypothetical protein